MNLNYLPIDAMAFGSRAMAWTPNEISCYFCLLIEQWLSAERQIVSSDPGQLRMICRGIDPSQEVLQEFVEIIIGDQVFWRNEAVADLWEVRARAHRGRVKGGTAGGFSSALAEHVGNRPKLKLPGGLRERIIKRDGYQCKRCPATTDLTIDHILPQVLGGTHAEVNLRTLCGICNCKRPKSGIALIVDLASDGYTIEGLLMSCAEAGARGLAEQSGVLQLPAS